MGTMVRKIDNRRDILLLMLYSPGRTEEVNEPISGRTRMVKMLFLFREEALPHFRRGTDITPENFYAFFPWNFGPFSREVYDDITFFVLRGFIEQSDSEEEALPEAAAEWEEWMMLSQEPASDATMAEYDEQEFRLAEKGANFTSGLYALLSTEQKRLLKEFKSRLVNVPLRGLLKYVYEKYEDQTTRSTIKDKVLGR